MASCAICGADAYAQFNLNQGMPQRPGRPVEPNWEWRCPEHWPAILTEPQRPGWIILPDADRNN